MVQTSPKEYLIFRNYSSLGLQRNINYLHYLFFTLDDNHSNMNTSNEVLFDFKMIIKDYQIILN